MDSLLEWYSTASVPPVCSNMQDEVHQEYEELLEPYTPVSYCAMRCIPPSERRRIACRHVMS